MQNDNGKKTSNAASCLEIETSACRSGGSLAISSSRDVPFPPRQHTFDADTVAQIEALVSERAAERANKRYKEADALRQTLISQVPAYIPAYIPTCINTNMMR